MGNDRWGLPESCCSAFPSHQGHSQPQCGALEFEGGEASAGDGCSGRGGPQSGGICFLSPAKCSFAAVQSE